MAVVFGINKSIYPIIDSPELGNDFIEFPEDLAERIAGSLKDGDWEKKLEEISVEYKKLNRREKRQYFTDQEAEDYGGLAYYCIMVEPLLIWGMKVKTGGSN